MIKPSNKSTQNKISSQQLTVTPDSIEKLRQRLGPLERHQILAWQRMSPEQRLEIAYQAYQFALEAVRLTEQQRHPDLSEEEFNWRVTRRMQGNQKLGRESDVGQNHTPGIE